MSKELTVEEMGYRIRCECGALLGKFFFEKDEESFACVKCHKRYNDSEIRAAYEKMKGERG